MAAYIKFGDINGESKDAFVFKSQADTDTADSDHKGWIPIETMSPPATKPSQNSEELTMSYEAIKWTYDEADDGGTNLVEWTY